MKANSLPILALVMLLPVAVVAFLAVRTLSLESDALNLRHERLAKQRMDAAAAGVVRRLHRLGEDLLQNAAVAYEAQGAVALSALARKRTFVSAAVFENGVPQYSATALEHQYEYARSLNERAQAIAASLNEPEASRDELVPAGGAYALLRCSNIGSGRVVCVVADSSAVTQAMKSARDDVMQITGLTNVGLVDPNGTDFAQQNASVLSTTSRPLEGLLQGWKLLGQEPPASDGLQTAVLLYIAAGALIAGWLAMTWMLHRSSVLKDEAAAARANVIAQLAHELRTPLANLRLHTDLLRRKASDTESVERYGAVLEGEIDRLSNLAENSIAVARGAMMTPKLEMAVADDCLRAILERFEPILSDAHCEVRLKLGVDTAARLDRTSLERCIINLLDNARKYAPGSEIEISSMLSSSTLRVDIRDYGPGISANQRELVFEPLKRGAGVKGSGFGLGLAAVRAMARQNGGDCRIDPVTPGVHFVLTMQAFPVEETAAGPTVPC